MASGSSVRLYHDPDAFPATLHDARISVLPQQRGAYRARITLVRLGGLQLALGEETLARLYQAELPAHRLYVRLKPPGDPASFANGEAEPPGSIGLRHAGLRVVERSPAAAVIRSLSITWPDLLARAEALLGRRPAGLDLASHRLGATDAGFARLAALQATIFRLAERRPAALARPATAAALDAQLGEALLAVLDGAVPLHDSAAQRRGDAIMRRAEARLAADPARPPSLTALCAAAGCSAKTLEVLFRERYGETPVRHLRARRLHAARRALLAADPLAACVGDIAFDHGFWELGRFAGAYRARFGEAPSQTLRHKRTAGMSFASSTISA